MTPYTYRIYTTFFFPVNLLFQFLLASTNEIYLYANMDIHYYRKCNHKMSFWQIHSSLHRAQMNKWYQSGNTHQQIKRCYLMMFHLNFHYKNFIYKNKKKWKKNNNNKKKYEKNTYWIQTTYCCLLLIISFFPECKIYIKLLSHAQFIYIRYSISLMSSKLENESYNPI